MLEDACKDPEVEEVAKPFLGDHNDTHQLITSLKTIYNQLVSFFVKDANGKIWYDDEPFLTGSILPVYTEVLNYLLRNKKSALERHHLFPRAWLNRNGVTEQRETNQITNYALVEWSDNIHILDSNPSEYLPYYLDRLTSDEKIKMYYWHALPANWEGFGLFSLSI